MTHPNLDELRGLLAKATPGPWEVDSEYDNDALYSGGGGCGKKTASQEDSKTTSSNY